MTCHETLNKALHTWLELIGGVPAGGWRTIGQYRLKLTIDELNESLELDDTGVTAAMLLRSLLEAGMDNTEFTLRQAYTNETEFCKTMQATRRLHDLLADPVLAEPVNEFAAKLRQSLEHYGAGEAALRMVADPAAIGVLRRDALRSMANLQPFQFLRGETYSKTAGYNPWVLQFLNINSLVEAVSRQPEFGVSLCMIRDEDPVFSYFAFACWNGGTLTLLSDRPTWPHPLAKQMVRRPDRHLAERWGNNHFPYELLDAEFGHRHVHIPRKQGLVRYDLQASKLKRIGELEADVAIWLAMMFELIERRFFTENLQLPEQCYTAEMVQTVIPRKTTVILRDNYQPCVLSPLTGEEVTFEKLRGDWEIKPTGQYLALEKFYAPRVPDQLLNLLKDDRQKLLLPPDADKKTRRLVAELTKKDRDGERGGLSAATPTDFGTPAELQRHQRWAARYNQAKAAGALAAADFKERAPAVYRWFRNAVQANAAALRDAAAVMSMQITGPAPRDRGGASYFEIRTVAEDTELKPTEILAVRYDHTGRPRDPWQRYYMSHEGTVVLDGGMDASTRKRRCHVNGTMATLCFGFKPSTPEQVAGLIGRTLAELPQPVREFYYLHELYAGNNILNSVDPWEWVVENPWKELKLYVRLFLSKSGFNELRRSRGLPKYTDFDSLRSRDDPRHPKYEKPSRF